MSTLLRWAVPLAAIAGLLVAPDRALADGWIHVGRPVDLEPSATWQWGGLIVTRHHVDASITSDLVTVEVREIFHNPHPRELEGTYYFPLPAGAGVDDFRIEMGGRELAGEVLPRDEARRIYEDLVRRVRDPALLEYYDRGLVRARVFPIPALGDVAVTLTYRMTASASGGLGTFRYPFDTGRFSGGPYRDVRIHVAVQTDTPLRSVSSPTHDVVVAHQGLNNATVSFVAPSHRAERDFVVEFMSSASPLAGGVRIYREPGEDGYFVLRLSPGREPPAHPTAVRLVFLVDVSGSMAGQKILHAKGTLESALARLRSEDEFQLLAFSTGVRHFEPEPVRATPANIERARRFISELVARGGTDIDSALCKAVDTAHQQGGASLLLISDGAPTVGVTDPSEIVRRARSRAGGDARVHVFGLGHDVNTVLLDDLSRHLGGSRSYLQDTQGLEAAVSGVLDRVLYPSLSGIAVRAVGAEIHTIAPREPSDLFFGEDLILAGRYRGAGLGRLEVVGVLDGMEQHLVVQTDFLECGGGAEAAFQWAQLRILDLLDELRSATPSERASLQREVAELGLRYGIVTPYTSFLIREEGSYVAGIVRDRVERQAESREQVRRAERGFNAAAGAPALDYADAQASRKKRLAEGKWALEPNDTPSESAQPVEILRKGARALIATPDGWVDGSLRGASQPIPNLTIAFASEAYFEFLRQHPEVGSLLAAGDSLVFEWGGTIVRIVAASPPTENAEKRVESF
ncbi:MAG: VIT domain-containing protein [Planctomycetota bacterium]